MRVVRLCSIFLIATRLVTLATNHPVGGSCTSGFPSIERIRGVMDEKNKPFSYPTNTQAIIPSMKFITNGTLKAWILAADFGDSLQPTPNTELQIWRPMNGNQYYEKVGFTPITTQRNSSRIYYIYLDEPLPYQVGDIIGYYQSKWRHRVLIERIEQGLHHLYYKYNENSASDSFNVSAEGKYKGKNSVNHALISVIADGGVGFMSIETINHLLGPEFVPLSDYQLLAPSMRFTCNGFIVRWIFGVQWIAGLHYPEFQLWNKTDNDTYEMINSTNLTRITKNDINVYEYSNFPPLPVYEGLVLGLSLPPNDTARLMLVAEDDVGPLNSVYRSKPTSAVIEINNVSPVTYRPLVSAEIVPVRTTRPGTTAGHGVGVGVSSGTLSVLLITFLAVIAIALFLYIRKRRVKSRRNLRRGTQELSAQSPMADYDVLTPPLNSYQMSQNETMLTAFPGSNESNKDTTKCLCEETHSSTVGYYVPTKEQRVESNNNFCPYIVAKENELFVEKERFWSPATTLASIFEQLFNHKFREIERHNMRVGGSLGTGEFGVVSRGNWMAGVRGSVEVAIKTLRPAANEDTQIMFLQEAAIIGQFKHPNIVRLHGVVTTQEPMMLVMEFMANGDLRNYLISVITNPDEPVQAELSRLCLTFCQQIASGMSYLADKAFIHRDLAARNILVSENQVCKVADFGMSHALEDNSDYYRSQGGKIPVKWTAPEGIYHHKFTTASDVWSFGCVMYEIWSFGHKPFESFTNSETMEIVIGGFRLSPPPGCPRQIYSLMIDCWHPEIPGRPSFPTLCQVLAEDADTLLNWRQEDSQSHPQAPLLGAPLEAGASLFPNLQGSYKENH